MLGRLHAVPATADLDAISLGVLCTLIFFVGYGIGNDTTMLARFRSLSPGLALLPAVSILGSLAGSLAVAMLAGGHSPAEWLAVGSGMGYYSISSVLITGYRGTELGTIALLSNIVREMIALLGAPLLVRLFGTLAPIAAAGATAMDTTLPVISRTCGPRLVPVSIYCGMATDFSVPFLVLPRPHPSPWPWPCLWRVNCCLWLCPWLWAPLSSAALGTSRRRCCRARR